MMDFVENNHCLLCDRYFSAVWAEVNQQQAVQCSCGFVWLRKQMTDESVERYYQAYGGNTDYFTKEKLEQRERQYEQDAAWVEETLKLHSPNDHIAILDIGCSTGTFTKKLGVSGRKLYGIELNTGVLEAAKQNGVEIVESIEQLESIDVVIFRGTIQHLRNPKQVLESVSKKLTTRGVIFFLATPNIDSFCAQNYRANWNLFDPLAHLYYFSDRTLTILLERFGFRMARLDFPYLNTPYANPANDYEKLKADLQTQRFEKSGPFWGNIINAGFVWKYQKSLN
jgi:2-polyprenyl-3-methyl-5-hydroxy-6-metoxy-1,4-benzoquinol methylase